MISYSMIHWRILVLLSQGLWYNFMRMWKWVRENMRFSIHPRAWNVRKKLFMQEIFWWENFLKYICFWLIGDLTADDILWSIRHHYFFFCPRKRGLVLRFLYLLTSESSCPMTLICVDVRICSQKHWLCYCRFWVVLVAVHAPESQVKFRHEG